MPTAPDKRILTDSLWEDVMSLYVPAKAS